MACAVIAALPLVAAYVGERARRGGRDIGEGEREAFLVERVSKRRFKPFATLMVGAEPDCAP